MEEEIKNEPEKQEEEKAREQEPVKPEIPDNPEIQKEAPKPDPTLLEFGEYRMFGPENGDISIDRIELKSVTGANRIWKVKSLDKKQIILEVVKFG